MGRPEDGKTKCGLPFASSYLLELLIIAVKSSADVVSKALQKGGEVGDNTHLGKSLLYVATPQISLVF